MYGLRHLQVILMMTIDDRDEVRSDLTLLLLLFLLVVVVMMVVALIVLQIIWRVRIDHK